MRYRFIDKKGTGSRIDSAMEQKAIGNEEIASMLNVSPSTVQSWRRGRTLPKLTRFYTLGVILGTGISALIERKA